jgi:MYXO-CTERM domain-containing protein
LPPDFELEDALVGGFEDGGAEDESDLLLLFLLLLLLLAAFFTRRRQSFAPDGLDIPEFLDATRDECGL